MEKINKGTITIVQKDLLTSDKPFICHQVNCLGIMGGGVAYQIKNTYNSVYKEYVSFCQKYEYDTKLLLGKVLVSPINENQSIANMFAQADVCAKVNTNYEMLRHCLRVLNSKKQDIAIPYKIGCGLGGGDWNTVLKIIEDECKDINVEICKL